MPGRIRAVRTFGTNAALRETLLEFQARGEGWATTLGEPAEGRVRAICRDVPAIKFQSFDKFVARCLTQAGASMLPTASQIQEREALAQVCRAIPPESPFYACREFPGFVRRLGTTLHELRLWRWSAEALDAAAAGAEPWLAAKLTSLASIDRSQRAVLRSAARELATDRLERSLEQALGEPKPRLWVYAGSRYSPLEADWLNWAARQGVEILLVADGHSGADGLFRDADRLLEAVAGPIAFKGGANGLAEGLFALQPPLDLGLNVRIVRAGDALSECEWALRILAEEVEGGMEWGRGAIYARNTSDYAPLLHFAADRFGVALRHAERQTLEANGLIRFLIQFLETVAKPSPRDLRDLAASSIVGNASDLAVRQRSVLALASGSDDPWLSLGERLDPNDPADGWLLDAVRLRAKRDLPDVSFWEWADEIGDLLQSPWMTASLQREGPTRVRDGAAAAKLQTALTQRAELASDGDRALPFETLVFELKNLARQNELVVAPGEAPGVTVASASAALGGADVVVVLGMVEGSFPRRRSEDPVLSDQERAAIDALSPDRPRLPTSRDEAAAERDELVRLCAAAGRELVLMYPQVEDDRDNTPAFYLDEVRRVGGGAIKEAVLPSGALTPPPEDLLFEADRRLSQALQDTRVWPSPPELCDETAELAVRGGEDEGVSPSELRDAIRCPFQYAFKRRLKVFAERAESRWWRLRQLPQAVGLAGAPSPEAARESLRRALESEMEAIGPELSPSDARLMRAGGERLIREWIAREFLAREIWEKDPGTASPNAAFGEAGTAAELPAGEGRIRLRGQIPVVSEMQGYAVGQLYGARRMPVEKGLERIEDDELAEVGAYLFALAKRKPDVALEVDTLSGERVLFVLPRKPEVELESRTEQKLRVVDLGDKRAFFERVKAVLAKAAARIAAGEVRPIAGDHCRTCDYGELCRSAKDWGDPVDPFALDGGTDDA